MSFFPRAFVGSDPSTSFTPLFRLLDDFDNYNRGNNNHSSHQKSFNPRFDVKELADSYELHGELPGVEQKDVEIEFTDSQTITVRGRVERSYTRGTPPAALLGEGAKAGAITEGGHQATVEDEDATAKNGDAPTSTEISSVPAPAHQKQEDKLWVSERSIGQFSRSFSFPARVDQDAVKASMKNGILSIVVPKTKKHESRKITIDS
jgi:HSP20 family protein